jgi:hypothetical protein
MAKEKLCSTCIHSHVKVYIDRYDFRRGTRRKKLENYIMERAYKNVHCKMVKKDPDFPHKLGEMSNWDEKLLPQHCGRYEQKPNLLLFNQSAKHWHFIGAYSTPEICQKAEDHVLNSRVVSSLVEFKFNVPKSGLRSIANNLFVRIPVTDEDLTHELIWDLLQTQLSDNDTFDKINMHDWIRSIFPLPGSRNKFELMVRFGMYNMLSLRTILCDLRNPKYSRGPVMDIRPLFPGRNFNARNAIVLDGSWEAESRFYEQKIYVRHA